MMAHAVTRIVASSTRVHARARRRRRRHRARAWGRTEGMTRGKRGFGMRGARVTRACIIGERDDACDDVRRRVIDTRARAWRRTGWSRAHVIGARDDARRCVVDTRARRRRRARGGRALRATAMTERRARARSRARTQASRAEVASRSRERSRMRSRSRERASERVTERRRRARGGRVT